MRGRQKGTGRMAAPHRIRIASAAAAVLLGGSLLGAGAAEALPANHAPADNGPTAHPARPYGTVLARSGVNVRRYPTTNSTVVRVLHYRQQIGLRCKVRSDNVGGNRIWYKLRDARGWVSARYVQNTGNVSWCPGANSSVENSEASRHAMG